MIGARGPHPEPASASQMPRSHPRAPDYPSTLRINVLRTRHPSFPRTAPRLKAAETALCGPPTAGNRGAVLRWAPALAEGSPRTDSSMTSAGIRGSHNGGRQGQDHGGNAAGSRVSRRPESLRWARGGMRKGRSRVRNGCGKVRRGERSGKGRDGKEGELSSKPVRVTFFVVDMIQVI